MAKYLKSGLTTLIITIPWTILSVLKFLDQGINMITKAFLFYSTIFIIPVAIFAIITTVLVDNTIKKRPNIKTWYVSGLKSFKFTIPLIVFIGGLGFIANQGFSKSTTGTILIIIIALLPAFLFGVLPVTLSVIFISYLKNRK